MTAPAKPAAAGSRKAANALARQSRRPSRLGDAAGAAPGPDQGMGPRGGFPVLLRQAWERAKEAPDLPAALQALLTLDGHVPPEVQQAALTTTAAVAVEVLTAPVPAGTAVPEPVVFTGELGLTTSGRPVLRTPGQSPLPASEELVGGVLPVAWTQRHLSAYTHAAAKAGRQRAAEVADCRAWLAAAGPEGRSALLANLQDAALRTAPFNVYQEDRQYTNFRDLNTVTGKTLWPGHPHCVLSSLDTVPLELWPDSDVVMVVCLALLVRSAGYARIEEVNGTQVTLGHVAQLLEQIRQRYAAVSEDGSQVAPAASARAADLDVLAGELRQRRAELRARRVLYRRIHGALVHKDERIAGAYAPATAARERELVRALVRALPGPLGPVSGGAGLPELTAAVTAAPQWLVEPYGEFGTGLEALVQAVVRTAVSAFDADFAMSRGMRSLTDLVAGLRAQDWERMSAWELTDYFCCVQAHPRARAYYDGSTGKLADMAWAMSSRMQFNSWHFLAGNLPDGPHNADRDYFVPPVMPDLAYFSDQHHHGHVTAKVRFTVRSPQTVRVLGRAFDGFIDLRLLRCEGTPFHEQDLLLAHKLSALVAQGTEQAARLVADGAELRVTSFDAPWHLRAVTDAVAAAERS